MARCRGRRGRGAGCRGDAGTGTAADVAGGGAVPRIPPGPVSAHRSRPGRSRGGLADVGGLRARRRQTDRDAGDAGHARRTAAPGERAATMGQAAAIRAFGVPDNLEPAPLGAAELASSALLIEAAAVRDRVDPGEVVHLRHLVTVAIEQGLGPRGPETREADLEALRSAFLDQIDLDAPSDVAARWRAYFADRPEDRGLAAEGPAGAHSGRAVAGLTVDLVDENTRLGDELNVMDDVLTLCDVIAARDAPPPISVGLF